MAQLLHPNVLSRISNSSFYGNNYDVNTFLKDLTNSVFLSDLSKSVSSTRMNLQVQYVKNLISILNKSNYDHLSKAAVYNNLVWLDKNLSVRYGNKKSIEHRKYLIHLIDYHQENRPYIDYKNSTNKKYIWNNNYKAIPG